MNKKEKHNLAQRKYYLKNKESILKKNRKYSKTYYKAHKNERNVYWVEYYKQNSEDIKKRTLKWRKENRDRVLLHRQKTNAKRYKIKSQDPNFWDKWLKLLEIFNYKCAYCGCKSKKLQRDHIIPISRGGINEVVNILPACSNCNLSKSAKLLQDWNPKIAQKYKFKLRALQKALI